MGGGGLDASSSAALLGGWVTGCPVRHCRLRGGQPSSSWQRRLFAMRRVRTVGQAGAEVDGRGSGFEGGGVESRWSGVEGVE